MSRRDVDGSPKWGSKQPSKARFNPSRTFVMNGANNPTSGGAGSAGGAAPSAADAASPNARRFNPKLNFSPSVGAPSSSSPTLSAGSLPAPFGPTLAAAAADPGPGPAGAEALEYASLYHPPLHPLQYHTYAPTPFRMRHHELSKAPHLRTAEDLFVSPDLRQELIDRNDATLQVLPASNLPEFVHVYHSLVPLDLGKGAKDERMFGRQTHRYKAVSHTNGRTYCLLRVDGFQPSKENEHSLQAINKWKRVVSSSVVGVVEAFTTLAFVPPNTADEAAAQSLVVVYEWWPLSKPLAERLDRRDLNEAAVWAIAVQLYSAIEAIHKRQLAARGVVDDRYILQTSDDRVRLSAVGVQDVLEPDVNVGTAQAQDLRDLAAVIERLSAAAVGSPAFASLVSALADGDKELAGQILAPHIVSAMDSALAATDTLSSALATELENGRIVRLMAKLEFVLKDSDLEPSSPRYVLSLFRNYVFRQVTAQGKPSLNLAHVLATLNKLDVGIDENVLLTSGDGETRIVVSFKELKHMFGQAFDQMLKA